MKSSIFVLAILSFGLLGCSDNSVQDAHREVMSVHDEVMPKMELMLELKTQLKERLANPDSNIRLNKAEFDEAILQLDEGMQAMKTWMRNYRLPKKDQSKEDALAYLADQKNEIEAVALKMNNGIETAQILLPNDEE